MRPLLLFFLFWAAFPHQNLLAQGTCYAPLGQRDFLNIYSQLNDIPAVSRNSEIRRFVRTECLASDQIAQLLSLYYYDQDIYDFAIYAYPFSFDPDRYDLVARAMPNRSDAVRVMDYVRRNPLPGPANVPPPPPPPPVQQVVVVPQYVQGYAGRIGCPQPMNDQAFAAARQTLSNASFEATKVEIAKQIVGSNCVTSDQARQLVEQFGFESSKLDFAQYAFHRTYDIDNYHIVSQALGYDASRIALSNYVQSNVPANAPYANPNPVVIMSPPQNPNHHNLQPPPPPQPVYQPVPGYTGRIGCNNPMNQGEYNQAIQSISNSSFDNTRAEMAKQVLRSRCATVDQVRGILGVFSFENTKLEVAKFAFDFVYDKDNYYRVSEIFSFDSNKRNLMDYIRNR